jgi:L-amino acid N-acyltransferase YncA
MCNTAIDPAHRGKGLYARIVQEVIDVARAEGFQLITSKHHASNSAVLVPKLKAGFIITGLTLDEKYGLMVLLTYFVDPVRRSLAVRRIGQAE